MEIVSAHILQEVTEAGESLKGDGGENAREVGDEFEDFFLNRDSLIFMLDKNFKSYAG